MARAAATKPASKYKKEERGCFQQEESPVGRLSRTPASASNAVQHHFFPFAAVGQPLLRIKRVLDTLLNQKVERNVMFCCQFGQLVVQIWLKPKGPRN